LIFAIHGSLTTCAKVPARNAEKTKFYMDLWALLGAFYATLEATKTVAGGQLVVALAAPADPVLRFIPALGRG
jgi:hypothetical protein